MTRVLETVRFFLAGNVLLIGCSGPSPSSSTQRDELPLAYGDELQLARGVAEDFLISAGPGGYSALGPWSGDNPPGALTTEKFKADFDYEKGRKTWYAFNAFSIASQSMNASQTEAWVRGSVRATRSQLRNSSSTCTETVGFRIHLVKRQGKWLLDTIEWGAAPIDNRTGREEKGSP